MYKHGSYSGNVVLFNNKYIRVEGKCVFDGDLYRKGVYRLKDIVDNDGQLETDIYFLNLGLKVLWNANACWLVLIYNTLIITNVAKRLFKYVPYILL